jgi:hypothetical protein
VKKSEKTLESAFQSIQLLVNKANRRDLQVMWEYVLNPLEVEDMVKVEVEE